MRKFAYLLVLFVASCGYSSAPLTGDYQTISVEIFDNPTFRRGHEFALTQEVIKQIHARTPLRVVSAKEARYKLQGAILEYRTPGLIEDLRDRVIESEVKIKAKIKFLDTSTGKTIFEKELAQASSFSTRRGESELSARKESMEKLAQKIVSSLEKDW